MNNRTQSMAGVRRLVVKFGSGLLTDDQNRLSRTQIERLADQVAEARNAGRQVILVSSGAVAAGMGTLGFSSRPGQLSELQAAAAVGQGKLMAIYDEVFGQRGLHVAQVLLTHDDLKARHRHLNARNTIMTLLDHGIIPVINENDTVSADEIKFGDNDRLGALTATLIDADLLVILSHVAGLLDRQQQVIAEVPVITPELAALAGGTDRVTSVGGMKSKIEAARVCTRAGFPMIIANGDQPGVLPAVLAGEDVGTLFHPRGPRLASRKRWIAFFQRVTGTVVVDEGARQALCDGGKSLLTKGVMRRDDGILAGDVVAIRDDAGVEFARGLVRDEEGVLVHRDDLVIL